MGRETNAAREERLKRGGAWLRAQRTAKGWTQAELARSLDVNQVQVSTYERGAYEVDGELARDIARVFGISQYEAWRGLQLPLPAELSTRRRAVAWALEVMTDKQAEDLLDRMLPQLRAKLRGAKAAADRDRHNRVTRPGSNPPTASSGECSAI